MPPPRSFLRYLLYARKSGESEERQIQSIPDQVRLLKELAESQGFAIVTELTESKSAKAEGTRPVFAQMLSLVKRGEVDAILCWSVNRLSRNPEDSGKLAGLLQRGELRAIQTFDRLFLPQDNTLLFAVEASVANEYILELRRNTQRGTNSKVEQGWFPHRAPEGYQNDSLKLRGQRTISSDPVRFPLLRKAFERLLTGQYSVAQVHRLLTEEWGYVPRSRHARPSGPLPLSTFHRMVQSPFYASYFVHGGDLHVGKHPPMLSLDEFQRLQAILKGDIPRRRTKRTFAFTGLIKCAHCGGWVTAEEKRKPSGRTYRYYHCHGQKCKRWHVREEVIEQAIDQQLQGVSLEPEIAGYVREALDEWEQGRQQEQEAVRAGQERAAGDLRERLSALLEMRLRGLLEDEEYSAKKRELQEEQRTIAQAMQGSAAVTVESREAVQQTIAFQEQAAGLFQTGDTALQKAVANLLGSYCLERGELKIEVSPLFSPLSEFQDEVKAARGGGATGVPELPKQLQIHHSVVRISPHGGESTPVRTGHFASSRTLETGSVSMKKGTVVPAFSCGSATENNIEHKPNKTQTDRTWTAHAVTCLRHIAHMADEHRANFAGLFPCLESHREAA